MLAHHTLGWTIAACQRGASHIQHNLPCQDAFAIRTESIKGKPCIALAVADGHGDKKHDLSQYGAQFAVTLAVEQLLHFFQHFYIEQGSLPLLIKNFRQDFPRRLVRLWRNTVTTDVKRRFPLSASLDLQTQIKRYGSTVLVALVLPELLLLGQLGDGDILRLATDGTTARPFQEDAHLLGNATFSLISTDADKYWQTRAIERQAGESLLLATDGLINAFADEQQFQAFAQSLLARVTQFGVEAVEQALPQWLDHYSAQGSGDDITVIIFSGNR
ncbi:protein phosphatase 2C domain-containing protein [Beggiatoa leptomitoformis]|uniref:SpoIIE family protein phosphatase n=1 Tax=Beggiatoa leptomitoformis TaxID=288004 RepID=A0A2N9YI68_9GAMM|nr:protein phosphatase 2C domain-containing protein [Beggiatoa leptomitoformis]ALG67552.1 SpoIIE family protein phosphatase [Beggiatoa leptomitoformis]AUI70222.1 SpoIIE family protein phosphatase [Beggiatoa leptomitoformis]